MEHSANSPSSPPLLWGAVVGDFVYPKETKWHLASVSGYVPSSALQVKVKIVGYPGSAQEFKAWIDLALLSITDTEFVEDAYGQRLSLAVNLFEVKDYGTPTYPYKAFLGVAMTAEHPDLWVSYTELKIKLISEGRVLLSNVTQSNDVNYTVDPDQSVEIVNNAIATAQVGIGGIVAGGGFVLSLVAPPLTIYTIANLALDVVLGIGLPSFMETWKSDPNDPLAENPGEYANAKMIYGGGPHFANMRGPLELGWDPAGSAQIQIEITAKAEFWTVYQGYPMIYPSIETSISVTISL